MRFLGFWLPPVLAAVHVSSTLQRGSSLWYRKWSKLIVSNCRSIKSLPFSISFRTQGIPWNEVWNEKAAILPVNLEKKTSPASPQCGARMNTLSDDHRNFWILFLNFWNINPVGLNTNLLVALLCLEMNYYIWLKIFNKTVFIYSKSKINLSL